MQLVTVADVRSRLGFDKIPSIDAAILSALNGVTEDLRSELDTIFDIATVVDNFYVDSGTIRTRGSPRLLVKLSQGFVKATPTPVVESAPRFTELTAEGGTTATSLFSSAHFLNERGVVVLTLDEPLFAGLPRPGVEIENAYLQIGFDAGFAVDGTDTNLYLQTAVPDWLKQMAISAAAIKLDQSPVIRREDQNEADVKFHKSTLRTMIEGHTRYEPGALRTTFST